MRSKALDGTQGRRVFVLGFDIGDDVTDELERFAGEQGVDGASFTGLGAVQRATLAWWNWDTKDYERIPVEEQSEVLSLVGNIARTSDGGRKVHAHVTLGLRDGSTVGGHLLESRVRPTLEVIVRELSGPVERRDDEVTGLQLLDL